MAEQTPRSGSEGLCQAGTGAGTSPIQAATDRVLSKLVVLILLAAFKVSDVLDGTRSLHVKLFYWQQQRQLQLPSSWQLLN